MNEENGFSSIESVPWQERKEIGFPQALVKTIGEVLLKPQSFFQRLIIKDSYFEPILFSLVLSGVNLLILAIPMLGMGMVGAAALPKPFNAGLAMSVLAILVMSLLFFGLVILMLFVGAALSHVFILLFGGREGAGFKGTFSVLAYSSAVNVFGLIPFLGGMLSGIWSIVIIIIGYKAVHRLTTGQALLAYFTPLLLIVAVFLFASIQYPYLFDPDKLPPMQSQDVQVIQSDPGTQEAVYEIQPQERMVE